MWYKRACLEQTRDTFTSPLIVLQTHENEFEKNAVTEHLVSRNSVPELGHVTNVIIFLKETAASAWGSRLPIDIC